MPRSKFLVPLSHDHHHALKFAQMLRKNAPSLESIPQNPREKALRAVEFYKSDLVYHFTEEEEILYPLVKGRAEELDRLFNEIFEEHKLIKKLVEELKTSEPMPEEKLIEKLDTLGKLIDGHIRKEERELFPMIQETIPEEELSLLEGKIKAVRSDSKE